MVPELCAACCQVTPLFHIINSLKKMYFICFHFIMKYTIIFLGTYSYSKEIFILHKKTVRIMGGCKNIRSSYTGLCIQRCLVCVCMSNTTIFNGSILNIYYIKHNCMFWPSSGCTSLIESLYNKRGLFLGGVEGVV